MLERVGVRRLGRLLRARGLRRSRCRDPIRAAYDKPAKRDSRHAATQNRSPHLREPAAARQSHRVPACLAVLPSKPPLPSNYSERPLIPAPALLVRHRDNAAQLEHTSSIIPESAHLPRPRIDVAHHWQPRRLLVNSTEAAIHRVALGTERNATPPQPWSGRRGNALRLDDTILPGNH